MHILQKHKIDLTQEHHCSMVKKTKKIGIALNSIIAWQCCTNKILTLIKSSARRSNILSQTLIKSTARWSNILSQTLIKSTARWSNIPSQTLIKSSARRSLILSQTLIKSSARRSNILSQTLIKSTARWSNILSQTLIKSTARWSNILSQTLIKSSARTVAYPVPDLNQELCSTVAYPVPDLNQELCSTVKYLVPDLNQELCSMVAYPVPDLNQELCSTVTCPVPDLNQEHCSKVINQNNLFYLNQDHHHSVLLCNTDLERNTSMGLFSMNIHALHMKLIFFSVLSIIGKVLNTVNIKIFMIIFAFITCTYAEQSQGAYNGLTTTDILSLDSSSNTMFLSLTTHIECTDVHKNMLQSSSTSSVPYTVIYQEYSPPCASHYMHEFYRYDYLFKLQGPFNIQMYANVIEIAMRVLQNTMLKHDFLNCIHTILYYRLMPFADILSRRFIFKTSHRINKFIPCIITSSFIFFSWRREDSQS